MSPEITPRTLVCLEACSGIKDPLRAIRLARQVVYLLARVAEDCKGEGLPLVTTTFEGPVMLSVRSALNAFEGNASAL